MCIRDAPAEEKMMNCIKCISATWQKLYNIIQISLNKNHMLVLAGDRDVR